MAKSISATKKKVAQTTVITDTQPEDSALVARTGFPIVAIGASSGGLEAVTELLKHLPYDTGMAFIFIQHLSPDHKSILVSLLAKSTTMAVKEIEDMDRIKPDNIYVIPYNKGIEVTDGHIHLIPRTAHGPAMSIDVLFTSLAATHKKDAIGVVLSGNASDGTIGLKSIKLGGGITFAQDDSAKYGSMPESAINEGVADFVLSPSEIAIELGRISKLRAEGSDTLQESSEHVIDDDDPDLKTILRLVHKATGVDFGHYKMSTIKRRILRRTFFHKLVTIQQYVKLLHNDAKETDILYNDLLINFTEFFRDADSLGYFKSTLLPSLLKDKAPGEKLRIWVAACSTGQEAYSIAMILIEVLGEILPDKQVMIFATDLSEKAIKKARTGEYAPADMKGVSPERLERFFTKTDNKYCIKRSVRDLCTFGAHNILSSPPFSRIDMVSCCNLLIYLDAATQEKLFKTFHYSLNNGGCLMLGKSETTGSTQFFSRIGRQFKIYTRKEGVHTMPDLIPAFPKTELQIQKTKMVIQPTPADTTINTILFQQYMPAYVVINHDLTILQFKGATSKYLRHSTGKATLNILNMARPEIAFELLDAIKNAIETKNTINKQGIEITTGTETNLVSIDVIPIREEGAEPQLLVIFTEREMANTGHTPEVQGNSAAVKSSTKKLEEALAVVNAELVSVRDENGKANKILQAAKEELETSKEEIESANEELITTNQELQTRNEQLAEAYDFSEAIVTTLHEPMLILDRNLRVKSANNAFYKIFQVLQTDTEGMLLYELGNHQWDIPGLREHLESITLKETYFYDYEITHVFPSIGKRTILLNARRIVQKGQHEQLILLAFTDVTEKIRKGREEKKGLEDIISKRTQELELSYKALTDQNISLEKMNKELETFTFLSSHDLQEPLRKIRTFASCLLDEEKDKLSATGKDYLQRMQETVRRMQMLIEDLLSYSRVKSGPQQFENADLNIIANEVIADFAETIADKKAVIKLSGLCEVSIIRFQFRQLLYNLVSNALKFSDAGRPPRITIKGAVVKGSKTGNDTLQPERKYCHISVADNGIGFDPQYKDRIFEVFQRLHEYDEYKGTGIGLAICKRVLENHNGTITVNAELNKGVRFDIYFPMEQ